MAQEEMIARVLTSAVSLLGLLVFLRWPYQHLRSDWFRDELFDIRAELFRYAAAGNISFDHPAYWLFRRTLNGFIRFGNKFGILTLGPLALLGDEASPRASRGEAQLEWDQAAENLAPEARQKVLALRRRMHRAVAWHLALSSPMFLVLVIPILAVLCLLAVVLVSVKVWFRSRLDSVMGKMDSAALDFGDDQPRAA